MATDTKLSGIMDKYIRIDKDYIEVDASFIANMPILKVIELSRMYGKLIKWQTTENQKIVAYGVNYRRDSKTESLMTRRELDSIVMGAS